MVLKFRNKYFAQVAALVLCLVLPSLAFAGAKIKIDDTKYFQIGAGFRATVALNENSAPDVGEDALDINADNMRIYTVSQVHKNIQVEYNTEHSGGTITLLDAVAKFNFAPIEIWAGRHLPPSDRANLDGPFYLNAAYTYPMVQSFGNLGIFAGRDNGVSIHGDVGGGKIKWAYGAFEGLQGGADLDDNLRHTARIDFALGDPEPGFYTGSTYFGAKNLTTIGLVWHREEDGVGTAADQGDFTGLSADILIERTLGSGAVVNLEGAYYDWDTDGKADGTILQGDSFLALASYLMPGKTSIGGFQGQLQPYVRYQGYDQDNSNTAGSRGYKDRTEAGLNYVLDGFNAKLTAYWYVDADHDNNVDKNVAALAMQFQL
jgi:hypothetical protein|tara:strand:- start:412 stop:1536 length:1125 start_codon:yes stop_codon:yes gene_type:complete